MKIQWSLLFCILMFTLIGCGKEEFGGVPQSTNQTATPLTNFSSNVCSTYTLIKPKVDVVYVVDNSLSSYYIANDVKTAISTTISKLSSDFDYRVVGTPLLQTAEGNNDYQVMTNSADLQGIPGDSRSLNSASEFDFFAKRPIAGAEAGLRRTVEFLDFHKNNLLRSNAYTVIVLVSNGRDTEIEEDPYGTGQTRLNETNFNARLTSFRGIKTALVASQLRLFSVTAKSVCQSGWRASNLSYVKMAQQLYADSLAQDNNTNKDSYDLCSGSIAAIFDSINKSIKQVILPHQYRYAPITFANESTNVDWDKVVVKKVSANGTAVTLKKDVDWFREDRGSKQSVNTREGPRPIPGPGEPVSARYFVKFANLVTYPDCVLVTSVSKTEYFQYIVLPQRPQPGLGVRINGRLIPESSTNGWSNETTIVKTLNIKAPYPTPEDANPPIVRTGFMLKLNGSSNFYKSGDNVQVNYVPAGI